MAFDFKAAFAEAEKDLNSSVLRAIILGPSGSGKSSLCGTFGLKTLYLYASGEDHGPMAARALGGKDVLPVCFDRDSSGQLDPDVAYGRLLDILGEVDNKFGAVVLDGATELEFLLKQTKEFKAACLTDKGKHNSFAEGPAMLQLIRPVINELKRLSKARIHTAMTCVLDVQSISDSGEILESKPRLSTYAVAEGVIQQFPDVFVVGRMSNGKEAQHRIQFLAGVSRDSKTESGMIKKTINYHCRLTGVHKLPVTAAADLKEVIKLKKGESK